MSWNTSRQTEADKRETRARAKQRAKERTCPECGRSGALKIVDYSNPELVAAFGYRLIGRSCRWCGYSDEIRE